MYKRQIQEGWRSAKRFVQTGWNHATKLAGSLDRGVGIAKRLFGALNPAIEDLGGSQISKGIMSAFQNYDDGRAEAMQGYNNVQTQLSRVRRAVPEIDLD
jgi:hypothetical protein